jgi:AsmA protein
MSRRLVLILALACIAALAAAVAPWTLSSDALRARISAQLKDIYGLELSAAGRSTIAFLPVPRLKFEDIALTNAQGAAVARGGTLRGEFRILPILAGRLELSEVSLSETRIDIDTDSGEQPAWAGTIARLWERIGSPQTPRFHLKRLILNNSYLVLRNAGAEGESIVSDVYLVANWPSADSTLDASGSFRWRGVPVDFAATEIRPSALVAGRPSRFAVRASGPHGRLDLAGEGTWADDPRASGRASFETRSLRDFVAWSGIDIPLGRAGNAFTVEGEFTADRQLMSWPAIRVTLGGDHLDGAMSAKIASGRPSIAGTLAADRLDLSALLPSLDQTSLGGPETREPGAPKGADLDLRLSASSVRWGALRMEELAANILVKPGRFEASLNRATLNKGTLKGRMSVINAGEWLDLKAQSSFERLDIGALAADLGNSRLITGTAQGQFAVEASGETMAGMTRHLHGRANLGIRQGELIGIGLGDVLRRVERRPLSASLDWRGGRTPFDQAQLNLALTNGVAEITDGSILGAALRVGLQGRVSLAERTLAVKAHVEGGPNVAPAPQPGLDFEIGGSWDDPAVVPDARALIQRSGAAQPLLGIGARGAARSGQTPVAQ